MIYDPKAEKDTTSYWELENTSKDKTGKVLAGFKVRVIGATVKFT